MGAQYIVAQAMPQRAAGAVRMFKGEQHGPASVQASSRRCAGAVVAHSDEPFVHAVQALLPVPSTSVTGTHRHGRPSVGRQGSSGPGTQAGCLGGRPFYFMSVGAEMLLGT
jgi:hypothetical protein